jgi:hypothetical protein
VRACNNPLPTRTLNPRCSPGLTSARGCPPRPSRAAPASPSASTRCTLSGPAGWGRW